MTTIEKRNPSIAGSPNAGSHVGARVCARAGDEIDVRRYMGVDLAPRGALSVRLPSQPLNGGQRKGCYVRRDGFDRVGVEFLLEWKL